MEKKGGFKMLDDKIQILLKERYDFELERQCKIRNSISIPLSFVAIALTGMMFMFKNIYILSSDFLLVLCYYFTIIAFFFAIASLIYTALVVIGYEYAYIPKPSKTTTDIENLMKYYDTHPKYKKKLKKIKLELIESDLDQNFKEYYIECTDNNIDNNNTRSKFLYYAQYTVMVSIISIVFTFFLFFLNIIFIK